MAIKLLETVEPILDKVALEKQAKLLQELEDEKPDKKTNKKEKRPRHRAAVNQEAQPASQSSSEPPACPSAAAHSDSPCSAEAAHDRRLPETGGDLDAEDSAVDDDPCLLSPQGPHIDGFDGRRWPLHAPAPFAPPLPLRPQAMPNEDLPLDGLVDLPSLSTGAAVAACSCNEAGITAGPPDEAFVIGMMSNQVASLQRQISSLQKELADTKAQETATCDIKNRMQEMLRGAAAELKKEKEARTDLEARLVEAEERLKSHQREAETRHVEEERKMATRGGFTSWAVVKGDT
ncbi:unnamed protein product [Vitrella brassicaformis CCMP3155]|uniref:Uncharacterized protein n=1 Tax=Vitrella brassicaformis (strain CCMP3155) TaxID=1169540 RepID=A0A0G4F1U2_VITBC|nr:unnamed protein product [Vitrella brassicaformis CCMP3155]|eukprot:CEM05718.1 unnamed protein product [Vitrella brassicaformis CCMP3155]